MIILDDQDSERQTQIRAAGQVKSSPVNAPPVAGLGGPGVEPSSSHWTTPPPPTPPPLYSKPHSYHITPPPFVSAYPRSPARRFWTAFAIAFIIYFALIGTTRTVVNMASHRMFPDDGSVGVPLFGDGIVLRSINSLNWTSYGSRPPWALGFEKSAETSFTLPISSDELYLISRGSYQGGRIELVQGTEDGDDVKVNIRVAYHHDRALARSTICQLRKGTNGNGIGIYTPTPWWHFSPSTDNLHFEVTVTFPSTHSERHPLRINKFTTEASNFVHESGELRTLLFDDIELRTSNSPINLKYISVATGSLKSSNAPIMGHFNTSNSLNLRTSNAQINPTVYLLSTDEHRTTLVMSTSNGPIIASVSLFTPSSSGGNFDVVAHTSNGKIDLEYAEAPLRSCLRSEARTSNNGVSVTMHSSFEGSFEVMTSNARPALHVAHPADGERRRIINQTNSRGRISGSVSWGANDGRGVSGSTIVHTSNGKALLTL